MIWLAKLRSLGRPAQEGLLPHILAYLLRANRPKHLAIAAHLANPFSRNRGNRGGARDAVALEGLQFQGAAPANDVAAMDMATGAVGLKEGGAIGTFRKGRARPS